MQGSEACGPKLDVTVRYEAVVHRLTGFRTRTCRHRQGLAAEAWALRGKRRRLAATSRAHGSCLNTRLWKPAKVKTMMPSILKLDIGGMPVSWIRWQTAATLYARDCVRWEAGAEQFIIRGGTNGRTGLPSELRIGSIIAVADRSRRFSGGNAPLLTNRTLFQRDGFLCTHRASSSISHRSRSAPMTARGSGSTNKVIPARAFKVRIDARISRAHEGNGLFILPKSPANPATLSGPILGGR